MKILIDSDVLLDIALEREPFVNLSEQALSMVVSEYEPVYYTSIALANSIYLITKYKNQNSAKAFIENVLEYGDVIHTNKTAFMNAIEMGYPDLEDGIQIEAAKAIGIDLIITRNLRDYKNKFIPVKTPEQYLKSIG